MLISILIPNILGFIFGFISNSFNSADFVMPSFSPPGFIFPIVWTILYTLMGISFYLIIKSNKYDKNSIYLYISQLFVNLFWSIFFFRFNWFLFSFIWIILLIILVILMIINFYKKDKVAGLIQIPYLIWIIFAGVLNFSIYLLN